MHSTSAVMARATVINDKAVAGGEGEVFSGWLMVVGWVGIRQAHALGMRLADTPQAGYRD